jgi:hypothetical protein
MTLEKNPDRVVERVETAYGTLETTRVDGAVSERFRGSNRSQVEQAAETLRSLMQQKKQELRSRRQELMPSGDGAAPDAGTDGSAGSSGSTPLDVMVNESTASGFGDNDLEYAVIENTGSSAVSLDGYTLSDSDQQSGFPLPDRTLSAGESVRIYSSGESTVDETGHIYNSDIAWNNGGDDVKLYRNGSLVVEKSYSG